MKEGDYVINNRGTIGKIVKMSVSEVTMRRVSTTKGKYTDKMNTPYTFQAKCHPISLHQNWKIISTEYILEHLWHSHQP